MSVHDHGAHCNNVCSGFGGRVCPDPANCNINPRPNILPPRLPDPPFIDTSPPARLPGEERITFREPRPATTLIDTAYLDALLEAVEFLENAVEEEDDQKSAYVFADDDGLYVRDVKRGHIHVLAKFGPDLCRYPYLQDESCKREAGHRGEHGPAHTCDISCALTQTGCVLTECRDGMHFYADGNAQTCYCGNTGVAANA